MAGRALRGMLRTADYKGGKALKSCHTEFVHIYGAAFSYEKGKSPIRFSLFYCHLGIVFLFLLIIPNQLWLCFLYIVYLHTKEKHFDNIYNYDDSKTTAQKNARMGFRLFFLVLVLRSQRERANQSDSQAGANGVERWLFQGG